MLMRGEKRFERRMSYRHVVKFSYPALNSTGHEKAYGVVKKFCNLSPFCDALVNKFVTSNLTAPIIFPKKTWATTEDISEGGLSLVVHRKFEVGQDVLLFDDRLSHRPISARVRWCTRHVDNMFKAGLSFNAVNLIHNNGRSRTNHASGLQGRTI